uniref:non-specific serine/threonine protein kinase n=1 Tax=Oryza glumipatula TaxID=40148 RepID=A0A0E0BED1_9ORYZ
MASKVKPLGSGDTGSVHLVELLNTGEYFAMKAMDKSIMLNRNKVHRATAERQILDLLDHPFLPTLYASFQTKTHICLITDYCPGGELFVLLDNQPLKVLHEDAVRFYAAEVVVALEYLHCQGILLYEMLYGYTPFRGKTRQRTFANILHKDIRFPASISAPPKLEIPLFSKDDMEKKGLVTDNRTDMF